jgi:hypothetical protein
MAQDQSIFKYSLREILIFSAVVIVASLFVYKFGMEKQMDDYVQNDNNFSSNTNVTNETNTQVKAANLAGNVNAGNVNAGNVNSGNTSQNTYPSQSSNSISTPTPNLDEQRLIEAKNKVQSWVDFRFSGSEQGTRCANSNIGVGTSAFIIEVEGLSIQINKDMNAVTSAEEVNEGIEWRGDASISAKRHRFYLRFSGSDTWEKTNWDNYLAIKVTVKKQNGRWIVTSSDSLTADSKIMAFPKDFKPFDCNNLSSL